MSNVTFKDRVSADRIFIFAIFIAVCCIGTYYELNKPNPVIVQQEEYSFRDQLNWEE